MVKLMFFLVVLLIPALGFSQELEDSGIKIVDEKMLSDAQMDQLLAFNFEAYRDAEESVLIQVTNGPRLELISKAALSGRVNIKPSKSIVGGDQHVASEKHQKAKILIAVNVFTLEK